ncbi:MAG: hypothetical protein DRP45_07720, partial [Candidatus Zixiibacteriota bacterium]
DGPDLDAALFKESLHTWTLRGDKLGPGKHTVDLPFMEGLPAREQTWYIVKLDPDNQFEEYTESNNTTFFQIRTALLTAKYDADPLDFEFGRYIRGVKLDNVFELRLRDEIVTNTTEVKAWLGNAEIKAEKVAAQNNLYRFTLDMGTIPDGTELTYKVSNHSEVVAQATYIIHTFKMPDWINPEKHQGNPDEERRITWNDKMNAYWVEAINIMRKWHEKIPASVLFLAGKDNGIKLGMHLHFAFNLENEVIYQDAGPTLRLELFGFNVFQLNIPAQALLNAMGVTKYEINVSSIANFYSEVRKFAGSNPGLSGIWKFLQSDENKDYSWSKPGTTGWEPDDEPSYTFSITSQPFIIDKDLNLRQGEISVGLTTTYPQKWNYFYNLPPFGAVVQFAAGVELGYQLKTETTTGMKVNNNALQTMFKEFKLTIEGTVGVVGKANLAFGVAGVIGTAEAALGIAVTWPYMTSPLNPQIQFPMNISLKLQSYELWEFFKQDVWEQVVFKTDNVFTGPYEVWPPKIPPNRGTMAIPDQYDDGTDNNSLVTATDLGVVAGTSTVESMTLTDINDRDYYRFRTIESAGESDKIEVLFDVTNPDVEARLIDVSGSTLRELVFADQSTGEIDLGGLPAGEYVLVVEGNEELGVGYTVSLTAPQSSKAALVASIDSDSGLAAILPGQVVDLTLTVTNAGNTASPEAESALVWSRDDKLDPGDGTLFAFMVPALESGETWSETFSIALPETVVGPVYFGFIADRRENVSEAIRSDNEALYPIEIVLPPDRCESNQNIYEAFDLGGMVDDIELPALNLASMRDADVFAFQLGETGTAEDAVQLKRADEAGSINLYLLDKEGWIVQEADVDPTAGLATLELEGVGPGQYYLQVIPEDEACFEYSLVLTSAKREKANLAVEDIRLAPEYDLLPGTDNSHAYVTVSNYGADYARSFGLELHAVSAGTDYNLGAVTVGVLAPGEKLIIDVPISVPDFTPDTEVIVRAVVDPASEVDELNETDNVGEIQALVAGTPDSLETQELANNWFIDLGVVRGTYSVDRNLHSVYDQDMMVFRMSGDGTTGDQIEVTFDDSKGDLMLGLYDRYMNSVANGEKVADGDYQISLDGVSGGQYYLVVGSLGGHYDYTLSITAPDAAGPNLGVESMQIDESQVADGNIDVTTKIANFGDKASEAFTVEYYISTGSTIDPVSDTLLKSVNMSALDAGADVTHTEALDLAAIGPGSYYLGVVVKPPAGTTEPVEGDNTARSGMVVLPQPDSLEENDSKDTASDVTLTAGHAELSGLTIHNSSDVDWFCFDLPVSGGTQDMVQLTYQGSEPDLMLTLMDEHGRELRAAAGNAGLASLSLNNLVAGTYFIKIGGAGFVNFSTGYTLTLDAAG